MFHRGLGVFDHETRTLAAWDAKPTEAVGAPVFVPRGADAEGDGWLLTTIHDEASDTGSLAVFDARDIAAGPIARAHAEHRIPMGFHALWKGE
jgi:carotenoid cleavage dioxygenase-like enzyme